MLPSLAAVSKPDNKVNEGMRMSGGGPKRKTD